MRKIKAYQRPLRHNPPNCILLYKKKRTKYEETILGMLAYCIVNTLATSQKLLRNKNFSKKRSSQTLFNAFFFSL